MKRTKRYGGFRIGDKVQRKDGKFIKFQPALVIGFSNGYIRTHWTMNDGTYFESVFAPNQLINLTRIEEEEKEIDDKIKRYKNELKDINDEIEEDFRLIKDFVNEALRQTEIFLSPLTPYGDPLPSPYTRDVYTTTKDYD